MGSTCIEHVRNDTGKICKHCDGIVCHMAWCIIRNPEVFYAYDILIHPENLTEQDKIRLHAIGVLWTS